MVVGGGANSIRQMLLSLGLEGAIILLIAYLLTLCRLGWQLHVVRRSSKSFGLTKFFIGSTVFCCAMRFASFATLCVISYEQTYGQASGQSTASVELKSLCQNTGDNELMASSVNEFFCRSLDVLLNFPDYIMLSSYLILVLLYAEAVQLSRQHSFSAAAFRQRYLTAYMWVVTLLYATQLLLYLLYFFAADSTALFLSILYFTVGIIIILAPSALVVFYIRLEINFAGFPFKSVEAKSKARTVALVVLYWSVGRLAFGVLMIMSLTQDWTHSSLWGSGIGSVVICAFFIVCEVVPILLTQHAAMFSSLAFDEMTDDNDERRASASVYRVGGVGDDDATLLHYRDGAVEHGAKGMRSRPNAEVGSAQHAGEGMDRDRGLIARLKSAIDTGDAEAAAELARAAAAERQAERTRTIESGDDGTNDMLGRI